MISFERTEKFKKQYKKLPDKVKLTFSKQIALFVENPQHPSIVSKKNHAASNTFGESIFESRITREYRFLWKWNGDKIVLLLTIGNHEIVEIKK